MLYCIVMKLEEFVFYSRICIKISLMSYVYRIFNEGFVLNGCSSTNNSAGVPECTKIIVVLHTAHLLVLYR